MKVDRDIVLSMASAAQIRVPDDEADGTVASINDILDFCALVGELDTTGTPDFAWRMKTPPARRADSPADWGDREKFKSQAPTIDGDFFKVPRIGAGG